MKVHQSMSRNTNVSALNIETPNVPSPQVHIPSCKPRSYKEFIKGISACLVYAVIQPLSGVLTVYALLAGLNQFELLGTTGCFMTTLLLFLDVGVHTREKHCAKQYYTTLESPDMANEINANPASDHDRNNNSVITKTGNHNHESRSATAVVPARASTPYNMEIYSKLHSTNIYYMFHFFGGKETGLWAFSFFIIKFLSSSSLYFAYEYLNLGNAITLRSATAIFAIFIEGCILKHKDIEIKHWVVTILTIIGIIFMAQPSWIFDDININGITNNNNNGSEENDVESSEKEWKRFVGYLCGLTTSFCTAIGSLIMKKIIAVEKKKQTQLDIITKDQRGVTVIGLYALVMGRFILGIIFSLIVYQTFLIVEFNNNNDNNNQREIDYNGSLWWYLIGICIITLCMHSGLNYSLQYLLVTESKLIRSTDVIWAFILQVIVFGQIPSVLDIIGVCFIIVPVTVLNIYSLKRAKQKQATVQIIPLESQNSDNRNG